uniref:Putative secreted peptide n=1 Tax=Anopheles braziliensis TaxID=58242 RepID=A0A2M3ZWM0_9DIPT
MPMTMVVVPTIPVSAARPTVDGSVMRHVRDAPAVLRSPAIGCYALDCCCCCCCYYYCYRYHRCPVGSGFADSVLVSDYSRAVEASEHFAGLLPVT